MNSSDTSGAEGYKLRSSEMAARVAAFQRDSSPAGLERELSVARALCEDAINRGDIQTATILLNVIAKTSRTAEKAAIRNNDLLAKNVVLDIAGKLLQACADEFSQLPGWEERFERVAAIFTATIDNAENPQSELLGD